MNKYTNVEEVLTYLPRSIRESESKGELLTYIIRGYKELKIPQNSNVVVDTVQLEDSHNYTIPNNYDDIIWVYLLEGDQMIKVHYSGVYSPHCRKCHKCDECNLKFTIHNNILRLPKKQATYCITYQQLYSDELKILNDETLKRYLAAYATWEISYNRARTGDVSINLLNTDLQMMNTLYNKARSSIMMSTISRPKLETLPLNLTIDEFSKRL